MGGRQTLISKNTPDRRVDRKTKAHFKGAFKKENFPSWKVVWGFIGGRDPKRQAQFRKESFLDITQCWGSHQRRYQEAGFELPVDPKTITLLKETGRRNNH